jgi:hypothetical protein
MSPWVRVCYKRWIFRQRKHTEIAREASAESLRAASMSSVPRYAFKHKYTFARRSTNMHTHVHTHTRINARAHARVDPHAAGSTSRALSESSSGVSFGAQWNENLFQRAATCAR